jgi:hypothetical protein
MNYIILGAILMVCAIIGYGFLFYKIAKQSDKFFDTVDDLKEKAISATTIQDLVVLSIEINNIFGESWKTSKHPRIIEIRAIIETKNQMLTLFNK